MSTEPTTIHLGHGQYNGLAPLFDEGSPVSLTALGDTPGTNCIHGLRVVFFADRDSSDSTTMFLTPEGALVESEAEAT